jgi:UDP-N-acetylmuramate dehydrogenase
MKEWKRNSKDRPVKSDIADSLKKQAINADILLDEPMSRHTSFKTGGPCDILVIPRTLEDIKNTVGFCRSRDIKLTVLGNCTNILVSDKGIRGLVLKVAKGFDGITVKDCRITAQAGALLAAAAKAAYDQGLSGLEFASGIPGTVGGGVSMNAGAYGGELKDVLVTTRYSDMEGNIGILDNPGHGFGYRKSFFSGGGHVILESAFELKKDDKEKIRERMVELNKRRKQTQPLELPSAGSAFKRPLGYFTGKLIEDCELKGFCINDAGISSKHAGFIVNNGNATSEDIRNLIEYIIRTVKDKFGVVLETEIKFIGEW